MHLNTSNQWLFAIIHVLLVLLLFPQLHLAVFNIYVNHEDISIPEKEAPIKSNNFRMSSSKLLSTTAGVQCSTVPVANRFDCLPGSFVETFDSVMAPKMFSGFK